MKNDVRWQAHAGEELDRSEGFQVIACEPCGFSHVVPIPTDAELRDVYRHEYYTAEKPLYLEHAREDLAWSELAYRERYETFERHLPAGRRRLLDVGSGPGFFLRHGSERGWETLGIEPSERAAAHARELGQTVVEEFLTEELAATLGPFDAIHMNEVLEHVPDPRAHLALCRRMLAPDGIVCVAVPNDYNPFQAVLRDACGLRPWWVAPPHHLNYFDHRSLAGLLEHGGFEVVDQEGSFPMDLFLLMGDDYVSHGELGRDCHRKRVAFETNLEQAGRGELKRELYRKLAELGLGRHVVTFARRR